MWCLNVDLYKRKKTKTWCTRGRGQFEAHDNDTPCRLHLNVGIIILTMHFCFSSHTQATKQHSFWIGGHRPYVVWNTSFPSSGPDYVWLNGKTVNMTPSASLWGENEPNNLLDEESALSLRGDVHFTWNDQLPELGFRYVCERSIDF